MKHNRLFVAVYILAVVGLLAPAAQAQAQRFAFFDAKRALAETGEGKQAKRRLEKLARNRQARLDKLQKNLKRLETVIKSDVVTPEKREQTVENYRKAFVELQAQHSDFQREIAKRETQEMGKIVRKMQVILAEIGARDEWTAIFGVGESAVFYHVKSLDVTNELIRIYDKRHPGLVRRKTGKSDKRAKGTRGTKRAKGAKGAKERRPTSKGR